MSIDAYLARHAWADSAGAVAAITGEYQQVIVVPAFDEPAGFPGRVLRNVREQVDVLMIAVLNAPDSAPAAAIARTRTLLEDLGGDGSARFSLAKAGRSVLLVDCVTASRRLPKRQGVGLARKIGNDIALTLMQSGQVHPGWLFNTDADTVLPADYFDQAPPERTDAALTFPFHHVASDPALARKAALYELHLSYYRNRLAFAGSPYAFFTLGSTIAINPLAYAKVRGFPRRNAAEDFYLLNKLAKVGSVRSLATPTLTIDARLSERVPFGTGPALRRMPNDDEDYLSYAPRTFDLLRRFLSGADELMNTEQLAEPAKLDALLREIDFYAFRDRCINRYPTQARRRQAFHEWFDAFKTLKFVHAARAWFPDAPLLDTLRAMFGRGSVRDYLRKL